MMALILGLIHGVADAVAGYGLAWIVCNYSNVILWILLYNGLAFGYQPIIGGLTDRYQCPRLTLIIGLVNLGLGLLLLPWQTTFGVVLLGMGSACFHVGGGALIGYGSNLAKEAGLFTAPGIIGLAIGSILGWQDFSFTTPLLLILISIAILISLQFSQNVRSIFPHLSKTQENPLFFVLAITSISAFIWTGIQILYQQEWMMILILSIIAGFSKIIGGSLAQQWGWPKTLLIFFCFASILFLLIPFFPICLLFGIAILQVNVPFFLNVTYRLLPQSPATATSLSLGLAILVGSFVAITGLFDSIVLPIVAIGLIGIIMIGCYSKSWHRIFS